MSKIGYLSTGNERPKRLVEGGEGGVAVSPGSGISLTGSHQSQLRWFTLFLWKTRNGPSRRRTARTRARHRRVIRRDANARRRVEGSTCENGTGLRFPRTRPKPTVGPFAGCVTRFYEDRRKN